MKTEQYIAPRKSPLGSQMTRKTKARTKTAEWNSFGLLVLDYNVDLDWGFNSAIHDMDRRSDDSAVYESQQCVHLDCVVLWPEEVRPKSWRKLTP